MPRKNVATVAAHVVASDMYSGDGSKGSVTCCNCKSVPDKDGLRSDAAEIADKAARGVTGLAARHYRGRIDDGIVRRIGSRGHHADFSRLLRVGRVHQAGVCIARFNIGQHLAHIFSHHQLSIEPIPEMKSGERFLAVLAGGDAGGVAQRNEAHVAASEIIKVAQG
jgi:hypothetical protein